MISSKYIRHLILASLIVSLPVQPMSWLPKIDTWRNKVALLAGAVLCGAIGGYFIWKKCTKHGQLRHALNLSPFSMIDTQGPAGRRQMDQALLRAVWDGNEKQFDLLVKNGANINVYQNGITILILAARKDRVNMVKKLIELGAHPLPLDDIPQSSYLYNNIGRVIVLPDKCRILLEDRQNNVIQKIQAATLLSPDTATLVAQYLSPQIMSIVRRIKEMHGYAPLMSAARDGNVERIGELINEDQENSININTQDDFGRTALIVAVMEKQHAAVQFLLKRNADVSHKDRYGRTIYDYVKDDRNVIELLDKYHRQQQTHEANKREQTSLSLEESA